MSGKPKVYQGVRVKITVKELLQQRRAKQAASSAACLLMQNPSLLCPPTAPHGSSPVASPVKKAPAIWSSWWTPACRQKHLWIQPSTLSRQPHTTPQKPSSQSHSALTRACCRLLHPPAQLTSAHRATAAPLLSSLLSLHQPTAHPLLLTPRPVATLQRSGPAMPPPHTPPLPAAAWPVAPSTWTAESHSASPAPARTAWTTSHPWLMTSSEGIGPVTSAIASGGCGFTHPLYPNQTNHP